jgi:hypothetical protein
MTLPELLGRRWSRGETRTCRTERAILEGEELDVFRERVAKGTSSVNG